MDAHQTTIYTAILIASFLIGLILTYFLFTVIRHQRRNQKLYQSKILAEITTLENERKRMAADLHDELGPLLAGIKMKISSIETTGEEDKETLESVQGNLNNMMNRMREISNDLMPTVLIKKGLFQAIEAFISELNKAGEIMITFQYPPGIELPPEKAINLYRIIQEVTHNTIKHSNSTELAISIKMLKNQLIINTEDKGRGFDYQYNAKNGLGLGLRSLLSRTEVLGGNMYIDSAQGRGTKYTFEIPL